MHFDWTVNVGNLVAAMSFILFAAMAWRDMNWRVRNLEEWRKLHQIDADGRDQIIIRMDKILYHVTGGKEGIK
jgi:hypothetical protein